MKNLLVFLGLLAITVGAQTIATRPTLSSDGYRVLILTPNGPVGAKLGAGLTITAAPGEIIISAQQQPTAQWSHRFLVMDPVTRTIPAAGCTPIMHNGNVVLEGPNADYVRNGSAVRINDVVHVEATSQWSGLCQ